MTPPLSEGRMYPQLMPPIRIKTDFDAVSTTAEGQGTTLFDFGQNMAGIVTMTLTPKPGRSAGLDAGAGTVAGGGSTLYIRLEHTEITNTGGQSDNAVTPHPPYPRICSGRLMVCFAPLPRPSFFTGRRSNPFATSRGSSLLLSVAADVRVI